MESRWGGGEKPGSCVEADMSLEVWRAGPAAHALRGGAGV